MQRIIDVLVNCYLYDVEVFSSPWIYYTIFPAIIYVMFFFVKWTVLTAPVWLPLALIVGACRGDSKCESKTSADSTADSQSTS